MLDICVPCKDKGRLRAPYKTIGGIPMCGGCVADLNKPTAKAPEKPNVEEKKKDEPAPLRAAPVKEVSKWVEDLEFRRKRLKPSARTRRRGCR